MIKHCVMSNYRFMKFCLVVLCYLYFKPFALAINSTDHWVDVIPARPEYTALSNCAQPCLVEVAKAIGCWSYGCVCSEQTPGPNFINALANVTACAGSGCSGSTDVISATSKALQDICEVPYSPSATATATVKPKPSQILSDRRFPCL
jgi:hypothetical protein